MRSQAFYESLPKGPLLQHIGQIHAVMVYMRVDHDSNAFAIAEHSLRQIAVYTQSDEHRRYYESPEYHAEKQRERAMELPNLSSTDFGKAMKKAVKNLSTAIGAMRAKQSPERRESLAEARHKANYTLAVERERIKAQAFVRATSTRVRAELRDEIHINVPKNRSK